MKCISLVIVLSSCFEIIFGLRFLFHVPTPTYSHNIVYEPVARELSRRGHEVVWITTNPLGKEENLTGVRYIDVGHSKSHWSKEIRGSINFTIEECLVLMCRVMPEIIDLQLSHPEVKRLISDPNEHFDLVVTEFILYQSLAAWSYRFKAPLVGFNSLDTSIDGYDNANAPVHPYINKFFVIEQTGKIYMNFWERMYAVYRYMKIRYDFYSDLYSRHDVLVERHFGPGYPSTLEMARNVSLLLLTVSPLMGATETAPNVVYVNSLHIKEPKPLPKDLKRFLDEHTEGVVYFSLGSNVKSSNMPPERIQTLMKVFSQLPYSILWKWETPELPGKPKNVRLCQWCPQQDILAHKNIRLFIMQGGLQSIEEAIHFQVPILGLPVVSDQRFNMLVVKENGAAEMLEFMKLTEDKMLEAISKMMRNPSYKQRISELSVLLKDQMVPSLNQSVWWMEYVIRHKGAKHLRVKELPLYQYYLLDAMLFFGLIAFTLIYCFYKCAKFCGKTCTFFFVDTVKNKKE